MHTNITEADVKVIEAKVELMQKLNKLLAAMHTMQNNMNQLAERIVELEEKQKKPSFEESFFANRKKK